MGPLSLLSEDRGWRHAGPGAEAHTIRALPDFDHGGPRVVVDPIDGTRPWLHGLRSAWSVIAAAGPGKAQPRLAEVEFGLLAEIPLAHAATAHWFEAIQGQGCRTATVDLTARVLSPLAACQTPDLARIDHAFFSFFAYHPAVRGPIDRLGLAFFERLERHEGAQIVHCYDDQYIASGGQLALLLQGQYAMVCDPRPRVLAPDGKPTQCAKPYDLAGAVLCAREAGCVVLDLDGEPLNVPLDAHTPVGFVAYPGPRSCARLQPHWAVVSPGRLLGPG